MFKLNTITFDVEIHGFRDMSVIWITAPTLWPSMNQNWTRIIQDSSTKCIVNVGWRLLTLHLIIDSMSACCWIQFSNDILHFQWRCHTESGIQSRGNRNLVCRFRKNDFRKDSLDCLGALCTENWWNCFQHTPARNILKCSKFWKKSVVIRPIPFHNWRTCLGFLKVILSVTVVL